MLRVAELSFVKGMTSRPLSAVLPFLAALPTGTPVNVNTAPPEVLAAIANNLVGERLEAFVTDRARNRSRPWPNSGRDCRRGRRSLVISDSRWAAATFT
jgi:general secretion pathway protein K